jgi:hypothetical protein
MYGIAAVARRRDKKIKYENRVFRSYKGGDGKQAPHHD